MKNFSKKFVASLVILSSIYIAVYNQQSLPFSQRMAESIMQMRPNRYGSWNYETGTVLKGFEELWRQTGEVKYYNYIKSTVDFVVNSSGTISGYNMSEYNIDQVKEGCSLLFLYKETQEEKYKTAAATLRNQLKTHPRTSDGGFYHK